MYMNEKMILIYTVYIVYVVISYTLSEWKFRVIFGRNYQIVKPMGMSLVVVEIPGNLEI